ncbi:MAG TPA: hypothetical protein VKF15_06370 [Nitrososphaerales archaeon]|nr:hypothetical protein [Nitrososphaerales archaeon]
MLEPYEEIDTDDAKWVVAAQELLERNSERRRILETLVREGQRASVT